MSDRAKTYMSSCAFWGLMIGILGCMGRGTWIASEVHKDVQELKASNTIRNESDKEMRDMFYRHERDLILIKSKLGLTLNRPTTNMVLAGF